ncbi:unnamed protein product [Medioppia subpectinata]|uniref:C2H2-type domain-containing protein n=1 Tax=Medioppia subpectinata TaxID=1979941 RepID=A0A7R9KW09_9ACAR|nr:unnamed protein product [Medioppia subpectinata]CAG2110912.1 unnamed protein product [Medioppia subpectinata]
MDFGHKHTWNQLTHIYHTFTHDIKSFNTSLDAHPVPEDITSRDDNKHSVRQLIQTEETRSEPKKALNGNKAKTTTKGRHKNLKKRKSDESDDNSDHNWEQTLSDEEMDDKSVQKKRKYVKKSEKSGENVKTTPLKKKYKDMRILAANGKRFRPKSYICEYIGCDKRFTESDFLLAHIRVKHTKERPFVCDVCHKTFPTERCLRAHQKIHNRQQTSSDYMKTTTTTLRKKYKEKRILSANGKRFRPKPYICEYIGCDKRFTESEFLLAHIRVRHTMERPFGCDVCHKTFPTERRFRTHQKIHTEDKQRFRCSWMGCDSTFRTKSCLEVHMQSHEQLRQYGCDECDQRFNTKSNLQSHKKCRHSDARPYVCDWPACEATYKNSTLIQSHKETHLALKQYVCDREGCGKVFVTKKYLYQHKRQHSLPFVCSWPACDRRFPSNDRLQDHMNSHQGLRVVECPVEGCDKTFTSKPCARQHLRQVHKYKTTEGLIPIKK